MPLNGTAYTVGDHIDTDVIIPARYLNTSDPAELATYCMIDYDVDFIKKIKPGDIMVAGVNFGCGSSREHAPIAIKAAGISCVIANTFARIFYRNAINIGLPILECPKLRRYAEISSALISTGSSPISRKWNLYGHPFSDLFMQELISAGGLINLQIRKSLSWRY